MNNIYLILSLLFMMISGILAGTEIAFVCTNYTRAKKEKNKTFQKYLKSFYTKPEHLFSTILIGTNISIMLGSCLVTLFVAGLKVTNPSIWVSLILTPLWLIFAEMFPKSMGRYFREKFIVYYLGIFSIIDKLLHPFTVTIDKFTSYFVKTFFKEKPFVWSKDNIKILADTLHSEGSIDKAEKEAIKDVLGFSDNRVKDVMLPIKKVIALDFIDSRQDITEKAKKYGFTRYPVYKDNVIIGYINIYDLLYNHEENWHNFIRKITIVGINQKLVDVFSILQKKKETISLVNKGKKTVGFVSIYNLMEETISSFAKMQE